MTAKVEYRRYMPLFCRPVLRIRASIDTGLLKGRHRNEVSGHDYHDCPSSKGSDLTPEKRGNTGICECTVLSGQNRI